MGLRLDGGGGRDESFLRKLHRQSGLGMWKKRG